MSMPLTRRLQVLVEEEQYARLERHAARRGASVGTLVREAIDATFPDEGLDRAAAVDAFLSRPPLDLDDWDVLKGEIEDGYVGGLPE